MRANGVCACDSLCHQGNLSRLNSIFNSKFKQHIGEITGKLSRLSVFAVKYTNTIISFAIAVRCHVESVSASEIEAPDSHTHRDGSELLHRLSQLCADYAKCALITPLNLIKVEINQFDLIEVK